MATPTADISNFTDEQKRLFASANTLGSGVNTISSQALSSPSAPINLPNFQQTNPQELQGVISSIPSLDSVMAQFSGPTQAERDQQDLRSMIFDSLGTLSTKQGETIKAEEVAGIPAQQKQLMELSNNLRSLQAESLAIPLQIQEEFTGTGATKGGVEPIQTSRLRQNAIKSLSISAQAQAVAGNLALARSQVDRAIQLQFEPEERKLEFLKQAYEFNREDLERASKSKADAMAFAITERERLLNNAKSEKEGIENTMLTLSKYGAPQTVVERVRAAQTVSEAIAVASPYLQDPKAKIELQNALMDTKLKQAELNYKLKQTALLGQVSEKERKEQSEALRSAESQGVALSDKIAVMDAITKSPALNSVVGPTFLTRAPGTILGTIGAALTWVGIPSIIGGALDKATGERQNLIANVEQLVSKEFLDNLINVKAQGATFGALTEKEQIALTQAATKIGTWRLEDGKGKVLGYNASEKDFTAEIKRIQDLTRIAYQRATGQSFTPDEQALFDAMEQSQFNPTF